MSKTLYWVKFIDQKTGNPVDTYFTAESIAKLEQEISDIMEIKVIKDVQEL